jgi:hypothetical protein
MVEKSPDEFINYGVRERFVQVVVDVEYVLQ